eukprot:312845-Chlamydomonas_euryale.AAC.1
MGGNQERGEAALALVLCTHDGRCECGQPQLRIRTSPRYVRAPLKSPAFAGRQTQQPCARGPPAFVFPCAELPLSRRIPRHTIPRARGRNPEEREREDASPRAGKPPAARRVPAEAERPRGTLPRVGLIAGSYQPDPTTRPPVLAFSRSSHDATSALWSDAGAGHSRQQRRRAQG